MITTIYNKSTDADVTIHTSISISNQLSILLDIQTFISVCDRPSITDIRIKLTSVNTGMTYN